jgi:hypothetical protein
MSSADRAGSEGKEKGREKGREKARVQTFL